MQQQYIMLGTIIFLFQLCLVFGLVLFFLFKKIFRREEKIKKEVDFIKNDYKHVLPQKKECLVDFLQKNLSFSKDEAEKKQQEIMEHQNQCYVTIVKFILDPCDNKLSDWHESMQDFVRSFLELKIARVNKETSIQDVNSRSMKTTTILDNGAELVASDESMRLDLESAFSTELTDDLASKIHEDKVNEKIEKLKEASAGVEKGEQLTAAKKVTVGSTNENKPELTLVEPSLENVEQDNFHKYYKSRFIQYMEERGLENISIYSKAN